MKKGRCLRWNGKPLSPLPKNSKGNSIRRLSRTICRGSHPTPTYLLLIDPKGNVPPDFKGMEEHYDLSKMPESECGTHPELDALWAQNDSPANTSVGLFKF